MRCWRCRSTSAAAGPAAWSSTTGACSTSITSGWRPPPRSATSARSRSRRPSCTEEQLAQRTRLERAHRQATFLAKAGVILGSSLDYEATLKAVAQLAVPDVADWCAVDIADDEGHLKRLGTAHIDPAKVEFARTLRERFPEDPDAPGASAHVFRTRQPVVISGITDAMLQQGARSPAHLEALRTLQLHSYISVPLVANGRALGVMIFVTAESQRATTARTCWSRRPSRSGPRSPSTTPAPTAKPGPRTGRRTSSWRRCRTSSARRSRDHGLGQDPAQAGIVDRRRRRTPSTPSCATPRRRPGSSRTCSTCPGSWRASCASTSSSSTSAASCRRRCSRSSRHRR